MRKLVFCSVFIGCLTTTYSYGQKNCDCPEYDKLRSELQTTAPVASDTLPGQTLLASKDPSCVAKGYEWMADIVLAKKMFDSTEYLLKKAAAIHKQDNCDESVYLNHYKIWAALYFQQANYSTSLDYQLKVLPIAEKTNNHYQTAFSLLNISQVFNRMRQADKGIDYCRRAFPYIAKTEKPSDRAELLHRASSRYMYYYQDYKNPSSLDSCEMLARQSLELSKQSNNNTSLQRAYNLVQGIAFYKKDYAKALQLVDSSLLLCRPVIDDAMLATNYCDKADILMEMKNYTEARRFADSGLHYRQLSLYPDHIADSYALIYEIEKSAGNYKEALTAAENYQEIVDSLTQAEKTKAVNELEKKYNQAKNERTIKELAQQKEIYLLLAIAGLLAAVAIGFFLRQQSLKHKQKILEAEQRLNRARMNPHFFFNTLASLQSFALQENDGKVIASNLSKFSHIMRETLESTYKEYVTIEQEIDFLNEYLTLQQLRFPGKFTFEVTADKNMEIDELVIPSMIIQPFVENSIEHGFAGIDYPGHARIFFSEKANELLIEIKDNGKGLVLPAKENNEHISRASQIIKDRIYLLNIKLKTKAGFSIDNDENGKGVVVKIHLPLIARNEVTIGR